MELKAKKVAEILRIISNPNRLMILCFLEEQEYTVSDLCQKLGSISMPALSQHLNALKLAGIISCEKRGLHVYYQISDFKIIEVMKVLKEMYCDTIS